MKIVASILYTAWGEEKFIKQVLLLNILMIIMIITIINMIFIHHNVLHSFHNNHHDDNVAGNEILLHPFKFSNVPLPIGSRSVHLPESSFSSSYSVSSYIC